MARPSIHDIFYLDGPGSSEWEHNIDYNKILDSSDINYVKDGLRHLVMRTKPDALSSRNRVASNYQDQYDRRQIEKQMTQPINEIVKTTTTVTETTTSEDVNKKNVHDISEVDPPAVCQRPAQPWVPAEKDEKQPVVVVADKVVINE